MSDNLTSAPFKWIGTAFSCPHMFGWMPAADGSGPRKGPLTNIQWMDWAVRCGLSGVEIPLPPNHADEDAMSQLADAANQRNLKVVIGAGPLNAEEIKNCLKLMRKIQPDGAITLRATLSKVLCGDRRLQEGGWPQHLDHCLTVAKEISPILHDNGAVVGLENHQDATSAELVRLCTESDPDVIGVTFDTGNPLSVGEDILDFTRTVAPHVVHVHCKDYTVHVAPNGFRLVRCAAGLGVVPFWELLSILQKNCPNAFTPGVENAAQPARLVPVFDRDWWSTYQETNVTEKLSFFQAILKSAQPAASEWRTPWERGEPSVNVVAHEIEEFDASCKYLTSITQSDLNIADNSQPEVSVGPQARPAQILNM